MKTKSTIMTLIAAATFSACDSADVVKDVTIAPYLGNKQAAISFTYDDGVLCHYTDMAPQLEKRGLRATFWLIGQNIGQDNPDYPSMTWEQAADLARRGHEVSNHTWTHPDLTQLTEAEVRAEIERCDSAIIAATGIKPISFCYPYNAFNADVEAIAMEGRVGTRVQCVGQGQVESHCTDESLQAWLDTTIARGAWEVTMTHALSYGWDQWEDPEVLWRLYDRVKEREDDVWVAPFGEVAAYVAERDNTTLTVDKLKNGIAVTPAIDLDVDLYTMPLTLKVDGDFNNRKPVAHQDGKPLQMVNNGDFLLIDFDPALGQIIIEW